MPSRRISEATYDTIAREADYQCGYCQAPQRVLPYRLEVEHLLPISLGGSDERDNLWLSCHKCNKLRSNRLQALDPHTQVLVHNPRQETWNAHFAWTNGGLQIVGKTAMGRATVAALELNDSFHQAARSVWILAGLFPPV
jgi:5-methylcytosine-specific restriction endonuclease McrA